MKRIALAALALLWGCGSGSSPAGRLEHYRTFATRFGETVKSGNFTAAYEMTGRPLRAKLSAEAFAAVLRQAREKHGAATSVGVSHNTVEADGPVGDDLGFPSEVAAKDRRARMVVRMANGPDPINDCLYEVWINIADEGGQDRIVTVEIPGINM